MEQIFSVSQINSYIKNMFVKDYVLNRIYMKGEVSNCKYHTSGHIYFTLKDKTGQMACVMFAGQRTGLTFQLMNGQSVVVFGSINVYERDGTYQMYAKAIQLDGIGLLYEKFELLKQRLREEGLFDSAHKKEIPSFPKQIGIVTASTGAAIRDMVNIANRRNPFVRLILYPAQVQGEGAAKTIVEGIKTLDKLGVDTIIIGRGGGSIEDLWAFNEEMVARAVFACKTPIISAVGHETDTTISDFVADLRVPTPSAAAELAVNDSSLLERTFVDYHSALVQGIMGKIERERTKLNQYKLRLSYTNPTYQINQKRQQTIDLEETLKRLMKHKIEQKRHQLAVYIEKLKGLSPIEKLNQGYCVASNKEGEVVNKISKVHVGESIVIDVMDGRIKAVIEEILAQKLQEPIVKKKN